MGDKTILDDGASVTEFDAENIQTDKEKRRDGISGKDIRKADWGAKKAPSDPKANPRNRKNTVQNR
jgi:hypothetical protein